MKLLTTIIATFIATGSARALEPANVFLLANKNLPASQEVAEHYCAKRGVPKENIVSLDLPTGEDISRKDYDEKLAGPLREALKEKKEQAKVLLAVYGVPLRVGPPEPTEEERAELAKLDAELAAPKPTLSASKSLFPSPRRKIKRRTPTRQRTLSPVARRSSMPPSEISGGSRGNGTKSRRAAASTAGPPSIAS